MIAQIGRDVADAQGTVRIAVIVGRLNQPLERLRVFFVPFAMLKQQGMGVQIRLH